MVAFMTRNPIHRPQFEMTMKAMRDTNANLLLLPIAGMTKPGDFDHYTRVRCYQAIQRHYPKHTATLALLPLAMRMGGPREALWHALIRRNYGCNTAIACRDLAGWAPLGEVLDDLTGLADACISRALARLGNNALQQAGRRAKKFMPSLVVLGMGKLGAGELNFSSDIDLIFAYPPGGPGWPGDLPEPEAFYLQLGRQLIRALGDRTEHGFVFRVDMRLRPYGDSGPLVLNFDALADYYQLQGREWERYAMIKARPVAGPAAAAEQLMQLLRPFVYRRYLDFGAFESLRGLKEQIAREVERKGMRENIKLGPGGIREIEVIVQALQLVRGGRQSALQQRPVLDVLGALVMLGYLPEDVARQLAQAYVFLRRTENRLQAYDDQQVHSLPEDDTGRARLAFSMGYPSWAEFAAALAAHRNLVQQQFELVFAAPRDKARAGQERRNPRGTSRCRLLSPAPCRRGGGPFWWGCAGRWKRWTATWRACGREASPLPGPWAHPASGPGRSRRVRREKSGRPCRSPGL